MYSDLINERVTLVVSSRGDTMLEYVGTLVEETESTLVLENATMSYLMLNFQKGIFGGNINKYKDNVGKLIINKRYIISCDK